MEDSNKSAAVPDIGEIVFTEREIAAAVNRLAERITADYREKKLHIAVLLSGAFIFAADLTRRLEILAEISFIKVSSYGDSSKPESEPKMNYPCGTKIYAGKDVLIVDDILDTGSTLAAVMREIEKHGPNSVAACVLLEREGSGGGNAKYAGLPAGNGFLVGYGLDFAGKYRNLPYIAAL